MIIVKSLTAKIIAFSLLVSAILGSSAYAATDTIFIDGGPYNSASGFETLNLNSYGTSIQSIYVYSEAYSYEPGWNPPMNGDQNGTQQPDPMVQSTVYVAIGTHSVYLTVNVFAYTSIEAINITKNQSGNWIAAQINGPNWTLYNVNLGSGALDIHAWANANGYANCHVYADITY